MDELIKASTIKIGVIYKYTSPSGKIYIGQTINEKSRKSQHKHDSVKLDTYFGKAIRKYGFENLKYEVIIKFKPTINREKLKRVLDLLEKRYIKLYKSDSHEFGYNLNVGGEGNLGYEHTEEARKKISVNQKKRMENEEYRNTVIKNLIGDPDRDRTWSEESKQKMSKSQDKNKKKVCKYNLHRELIGEFNSIADAARSIDSTNTFKTINNRISECCSGKRTTTYEHMWMFSED